MHFLQRWEEAFKFANDLILEIPNDFELFYDRAGIRKNFSCPDLNGAITDYKTFISNIEKFHRKIPESLYSIGSCYALQSEYINAQYYYEEGLKAEAALLPFYLPFNSNYKVLLESFLCMQKPLTNTKSDNLITAEKPQFNILDLSRVNIIINHRKSVKGFHDLSQNNMHRMNLTTQPSKSQGTSSNFSDMKPIFINDMDFGKDKTYDGWVFTGILIDRANNTGGIYSIVQDDRGSVERIGFYNVPDKIKHIFETYFAVGQILRVANPYMRVAQDGKTYIRVENYSALLMLERKNICYYCLKEGQLKRCAKCQIAEYCSKECQQNDWKKLNHKDVCFK